MSSLSDYLSFKLYIVLWAGTLIHMVWQGIYLFRPLEILSLTNFFGSILRRCQHLGTLPILSFAFGRQGAVPYSVYLHTMYPHFFYILTLYPCHLNRH